MSAEDFEEDTDQEFFERDGETWVRQFLFNVLMYAPEFGGFEQLSVGDDQQWSWEFDEDDGSLTLTDEDGNTVTELPAGRGAVGYERVPLVPEFDSVDDVPEPDPDGPYADEPANPRGIVRFAEDAVDGEAIEEAGLYSWSVSGDEWRQLDGE